MCGGSNNASQQAERNERERQAKIAAGTAQVNALFGDPNRAAQYDQLGKDTTEFYTQDLNRQKKENDLQTKFALARNHQVGSSVQTDTAKQQGEEYLRGVIEAQRRGAQAGADLRASDEGARSNLLAMVQSGLDANTAASQSASMLRSNLESNKAASTAQGLGDIFATGADLFRRSREAKQNRQNVNDFYGGYLRGGFGYGGGQQ
ncbi:hypothetical protein [Lysobacter sp. CA199]|uniref:hypothetical protein n=1 Tax=Lysobacter sp. CA199 TaxID=3455608 RepID=UPI003F8D650E